MERLHVEGRLDRAPAEDAGGAREELVLSRRDLAGMDIESFGQLGERTSISHRGQRDFRLEGRGATTTGAFRHRGLLGCGEHVAGGARGPLNHPVQKTETTPYHCDIIAPSLISIKPGVQRKHERQGTWALLLQSVRWRQLLV